MAGGRRRAAVGAAARFLAGKPLADIEKQVILSTLEQFKGHRLRTHGGVSEAKVPFIINRPLKDMLERRAYGMITDTLQTTADPNLPEEMRWLAMFDEVGWEELPEPFWKRYAILTDRREHATAWMDESLAQLLMQWPEPAPGAEVPFLIVLLRGKCYLRMQYLPAETSTLEHATTVFTLACENALDVFRK